MAREYARVKVGIWADSDFRRLTDPAQALYFRLLSSPTMSLCGVADWRPKRIAALTHGMTAKGVQKAADELIERGYIVTDEGTEEVLVRSFVRHDGLVKTPNIAASMAKDFAGVASAVLRGVIVHELRRLHEDDPEMKGWSTASHLLREDCINPSDMPSVKPSVMPLPMASGNGSHIPQPSSLNQQPSTSNHGAAPTNVGGAFDEFWTHCPRKVGKDAARKAWTAAVKRAGGPDPIVTGLRAHLPVWAGMEQRFIPHPSTWLNEGRWQDEITAPAEGDDDTPAFWRKRVEPR